MRSLLGLLAVTALVMPGTAAAKGWISLSTPPDGLSAGERWNATLKFPRHPDSGPPPRRPELVVLAADTFEQHRFRALPTHDPAVFRVPIELPSAGRWTAYLYAREIGQVALDPRVREIVVGPAGGRPAALVGLLGAGGIGLAGLAFVLFRRWPRSRVAAAR